MLFKIDWLSFTVRSTPLQDETEKEAMTRTLLALQELFPEWDEALGWSEKWKWSKGRTPYKASLNRPDNGVAIFIHPSLDHSLIEVTGRACDTLSEYAHAGAFLEAIAPRLTRIDIAADMLTDTDPIAFTTEREPGRFKSHSEFVSESGTTCYIGSRTSDRYVRVYRYNPPHERAHLLRSEFVLKAEQAEYTARAILDDGLDAVVVALGEQFGWKHECWEPAEQEAALLKVWRPERHKGKTIFWLQDTVAPLLVKMHNAGEIDAHEFFAAYILPKIDYGDRL